MERRIQEQHLRSMQEQEEVEMVHIPSIAYHELKEARPDIDDQMYDEKQ